MTRIGKLSEKLNGLRQICAGGLFRGVEPSQTETLSSAGNLSAPPSRLAFKVNSLVGRSLCLRMVAVRIVLRLRAKTQILSSVIGGGAVDVIDAQPLRRAHDQPMHIDHGLAFPARITAKAAQVEGPATFLKVPMVLFYQFMIGVIEKARHTLNNYLSHTPLYAVTCIGSTKEPR